jgi:hypothetical protein
VSLVVLGGAVLVAVGALLAVWAARSLNTRWGEPRMRVIASRRAGRWVRFWLWWAAIGLLWLAGGATSWAAWCWSLIALAVAVLIWDTAIWLRARER